MRGPARIGVALLGCLALGAGAADASVKITTKPPLRPSFSSSVSDYVSRCEPGKPVDVSVRATNGDRVKVAGTGKRGGEFVRRTKRAAGAGFAIRVERGDETKTHHVRCLPKDFPRWSFKRDGRPQAQFYALEPVGKHALGYTAIFNTDGVPMWWHYSGSYSPWDTKILANGHIAWARRFLDHFGVRDEDAYEEHRLDGTLVRLIRAVGNPTDTHDLTELPNGNFYVIAYRRRDHVDLRPWGGPADSSVFDGEIQEVTPAGDLVWRWSTKDHLSPGETTAKWWDQVLSAPKDRLDTQAYDLVHVNSVEPDGDGFVFSARHVDAVYRVDRSTGRIDWKLGGTHTARSLTLAGPHPTPVFSGQHDARLWTDGTLTVHDNASHADRPPSAFRYRIDPAKRTARLVETVVNPNVKFSLALGGARKLPGGNWVVGWGHSTLVTEQTPDGRFVTTFNFHRDHWSYRANPVLPGRLNPAALRRGMDRIAKRAGG
ncbi:MAG TPA: arylsulfotransferase family protein [Thermoleophilaceae bacterium]|nr:arylsulfotransferase family protein [Thermoleophilaceae bacterium]